MAIRCKKCLFTFIIFLVLTIPIGFLAINQIAPISWNLYGPIYTTNGIAIDGYDPVAYHIFSRAEKGTASHVAKWNNVKWYFLSDDNKKLFEANPEQYAPEFGGYCATGISKGVTAKVDPEIWHIKDGKLFLFFDEQPKTDFLSQIDKGIIQNTEQKWLSVNKL